MTKKTQEKPTQVQEEPLQDSFEIKARENLKHLSNQRMNRFLNQAQNLRRNLKLRKLQQEARKTLKKEDC